MLVLTHASDFDKLDMKKKSRDNAKKFFIQYYT